MSGSNVSIRAVKTSKMMQGQDVLTLHVTTKTLNVCGFLCFLSDE